MIEKLIKILTLLLCVLALVACDEDSAEKGTVDPLPTPDCEKNDPHCFSINTHKTPIEGLEEYRSEVFGDGDVVTFRWDETLAWFLKSEKHEYGYDRDPYSNYSDEAPARGRDVYMSVETNKKAWVKIYVDPNAKKVYHLHRIDDKDKSILERDVVLGTDVCAKNTGEEKCQKDYSLPKGVYAVYYEKNDGEEVDQERYLHIFEYGYKTYNVDFVKFGDELADECVVSEAGNACYTREWVQDRFNEVMKQALVKAHFNPLKAEDVGLDEFFTIDLTEPHNPLNDDDDTPVVRFMIEKIRKSEEYGYGDKIKTFKETYQEMEDFCTQSGGTFSGELIEADGERYGYTANCGGLADNSDIITWNNKGRETDNAYNKVNNDLQPVDSKHLVLGINQMRIKWEFTGASGNKIELKNYAVYRQAADKMGVKKLKMMLEEIGSSAGPVPVTVDDRADLGDGSFEANIVGFNLKEGKQYRIYADVSPFVPEYNYNPNNGGSIAQITYHKGNPVTGGIVWGGHLVGDASLNTIVHEIGHSFGLTDLFIADDDLSYPSNYARYVKDLENPIDAIPSFAFDETNLMGWKDDSGYRLRYRPLFVVETGSNDRCYLGKDSEGNKVYGIENQWDCIRSSSACFIKKCIVEDKGK